MNVRVFYSAAIHFSKTTAHFFIKAECLQATAFKVLDTVGEPPEKISLSGREKEAGKPKENINRKNEDPCEER